MLGAPHLDALKQEQVLGKGLRPLGRTTKVVFSLKTSLEFRTSLKPLENVRFASIFHTLGNLRVSRISKISSNENITRERSQKFKVMNFEILGVMNVVDFGGKCSVKLPQERKA